MRGGPVTDVSIIIVNWHSCRYLRACLASIGRHGDGSEPEIVVIDSGSFDGCGEMLAAEFPQVRFIQSAQNIGFARANNVAARVAHGSRLLFLNPDTEIESPAVQRMAEHLTRCPEAGAVGCRLLNGDGSLQTCCVQPYPTILGQFLTWHWLERRAPRWASPGLAGPLALDAQAFVPVEVVSGACLMVRRSDFERVGGFSEEYFMYAEDVDLCHKLQQAGRVNHVLPASTVRHYGGGCTENAPSEFSVVMMRESIWRFLRKSRGRLYGTAYRASLAAAALLRLALLLPIYTVRRAWGGRSRVPAAPVRKWLAILAWSLGLRRSSRPA